MSMSTATLDSVILGLRADGLTYQQIGQRVGVSRQAVQQRLRAMTRSSETTDALSSAVLDELHQTNRLLAGLIVQVARTQTHDREYHISVLSGLGLRARQIAEALGTTEATINVTKGRARRRQAGVRKPQASGVDGGASGDAREVTTPANLKEQTFEAERGPEPGAAPDPEC